MDAISLGHANREFAESTMPMPLDIIQTTLSVAFVFVLAFVGEILFRN
jgi:hypothetical protein